MRCCHFPPIQKGPVISRSGSQLKVWLAVRFEAWSDTRSHQCFYPEIKLQRTRRAFRSVFVRAVRSGHVIAFEFFGRALSVQCRGFVRRGICSTQYDPEWPGYAPARRLQVIPRGTQKSPTVGRLNSGTQRQGRQLNVRGLYDLIATQNHRTFNGILKFANVAGPAVFAQHFDGFIRKAGNPSTVF